MPTMNQYSVSDHTWWYQFFQGASYSADLAAAEGSVCYVTIAYSGGYVAVNVTQLPGGATSVSASTNYGLFAKSAGGVDGYAAIQGGAQTALSGGNNWTWLSAGHTPLTVAGANASLQEQMWNGTSGGGNVVMCDMAYRSTTYAEGGGTSFVSLMYTLGPLLFGAALGASDFDRIASRSWPVAYGPGSIRYTQEEVREVAESYRAYRHPSHFFIGRH